MRHLPETCTAEALCRFLDDEHFGGLYDFVYVPRKLRQQSITAFGYAFINFVCPEDAQRCKAWLDGCESLAATGAHLDVSWSQQQGLAVQESRYRNSPLMQAHVPEEMKPRFFHDGARLLVPHATVARRDLPKRKLRRHPL